MLALLGALLANCAVFAGVGLGPLVLLAPRVGLLSLLALAPAAGYAIISVALTCLLMQEATVAQAAAPLTIAGLLLSAACLTAARRRFASRLAAVDRRRLLAGLAGLLLCLGLLAAPHAVGNKGYGVFRGNASDSFIYLFLANYFDEHPRAWAFEHTPQEIETADPTLSPARSMLNIRWTTGAMLAYCARLGSMGILEFHYPFTLISFLLFYAAMTPFLMAMGIGPVFAVASSVALATGFYGQVVLDIRAFSQINILPLAALLAWIVSLPPDPGRGGAMRRMLLLGGGYLTCFVNYTEIFPMIVGATAAFATMQAAAGRLHRREALVQLGGFAAGMLATYPVRFLFEHMLAQIHFTSVAPELWSQAYFSWLYDNVAAGIFGLALLSHAFPKTSVLSWLNLPAAVTTVLALGLAALFVAGAWRAFFRDRDRNAPLCALAFACASLAAFVLFVLRGKLWVAGKGLSYFYPFIAAMALYAGLARPLPAFLPHTRRWGDRLRAAGTLLALIFLCAQLAAAMLRPVYAALDMDYPLYVRNHGSYRAVDCNLEPLRKVLGREAVDTVAVCSADPWKWSFAALTLADDRQVRLPAQMLEGPAEQPVYVVLDRPGKDAPDTLGTYLVAANHTFALYRLPRAVLADVVSGGLSCDTVPYPE